MLSQISEILNKECKIHTNNLVLVGVSGGPDSLCLLHVLQQLNYPIVAMHVNHRLRPEAEGEASIIGQFTQSIGIEFISEVADVPRDVEENPASVEEAARNMRYHLLFEHAFRLGAEAVIVGHTADDQVETILMHIIRGTGLGGLRGMEFWSLPNPWSEKIPLIRPFLTTWREEIQAYIYAHDLNPLIDSSNQDLSYSRNKIRHELLPILDEYNPSIRKLILRMGQSMRDDYSVLQKLTDKAWEVILVKHGDGYMSFRLREFLQQPLAIQRYLLRRALGYFIPGLFDVSFESIERGIKLLTGGYPGTQTDLAGGVRMIKEGDVFWIANWQANLTAGDYPAVQVGVKLSMSIPAKVELGNGWILEAEEIDNLVQVEIDLELENDPNQAYLDINKLSLPLEIRARLPGDEIKPLGLDDHSIKISDVMINLKIPARARAKWPLICSDKEIVWVPGYRISHTTRITVETRKAIRLKLRHTFSTELL